MTFLSVVAGALLFWRVVPLARLFDAFQPMVVILSVMIAAVFVRLNRGMPSLEWKSLEPEKRKDLTTKIVELSDEYVWIVAMNGIALIGLVSLVVVGKIETDKLLSPDGQQYLSGIIGGFFALCIARIAYVVWRDGDIMRLQKYLIDNSASREVSELEIKSADKIIGEIKAAGLKNHIRSTPKEL